jgi:hypothetical protein
VPFTIFTSDIVGGIMYNSPTLREYNVIFDNRQITNFINIGSLNLKKSEFYVFTIFSKITTKKSESQKFESKLQNL